MKKIIFLLIILVGCSTTSKIQEGVFYKTRVSAGHYESSFVRDDKFTFVQTEYGLFKLKENPEIPDSSLCYIRIKYSSYDFHPDIAEQMAVRYFTWQGSELEYQIFNKIKNLR